VEPSYEAGTVWRIPRPLTEAELRGRLANLPAVFPDLGLSFCFKAVEEARSHLEGLTAQQSGNPVQTSGVTGRPHPR